MTVTLSVLGGWRPEELIATGTALVTMSQSYEGHLGEMQRTFEKTFETWQGAAADAAAARADRERRTGLTASLALLTLAEALNRGGEDLAMVKANALDYASQVRQLGYAVSDTGHVTAPAGLAKVIEALPAPFGKDAAAEYQAQLQHLLATAARIDTQVAGEIRAALAGVEHEAKDPTTSTAEAQALHSAAVAHYLHGKPLPKDPTALAALWETLTATDKAALFAACPGLGNRGGIPAAERDLFNREHLATLHERAADRLETLSAEALPLIAAAATGRGVSSRLAEIREQIRDLEAELAGYDGITKGLDGDNRFLLYIDDGGRGAISINNPDETTHTATYVPGTTSNLTNIIGGVRHAVDMRQEALYRGAPQDTAVVAWYGYNAPQTLPDAASPDFATTGAGRLESFQEGLAASNVAEGRHQTTVIGHSYGTTLVGAAGVDGHHLRADNVVLLASPGPMADEASQIRLIDSQGSPIPHDQTGEHIWATRAAHDAVPLAGDRSSLEAIIAGGWGTLTGGPVGGLISGTAGYVEGRIAEELGFTGGPLGTDPTSPDFGGQTFTSAPGSHNPVEAHSEYWKQGSISLRGIGYLIAGDAGAVR